VKRVGCQFGRVPLARREPPELTLDVRRRDACDVEQVRPLDQLHARAAGRDHRAAAFGVERRLGDPFP
jgi:hypothetical protein